MKNSLKIVLVINFLVFGLGFTPIYPFLSGFFVRTLAPIEILLVRSNSGLLDWVGFVKSWPRLKSEINLSKNNQSFLEIKQIEIQRLEKENELLRQELKVSSSKLIKQRILAYVLGRGRGRDEILLDVGLSQGVKEGDLVSLNGFLLGKVSLVERNFSKFLPTSSGLSVFEAVSNDNKVRGEVVGDFGQGLVLTKVLPSQDLKVGQLMVESQSSLVLGQVTKVLPQGAKIFKEATLNLPYDADSLNVVFVVKIHNE